MSRVFSAMTGTGSTRPAVVAEEPHEDERFVVEFEDAPFVEIGGPTGPIFSTAPKPAPEPTAKTEPRAFPRIAAPAAPVAAAPAPAPVVVPFGAEARAAATYLSVRFHDVLPRAPGRTADGPDPGLVALHFPDHAVSGEYRTLRDEISRQ